MGKSSSKYSNVIILTSEDPRFEDPEKICQEIASGFDKKFKKVKVLTKQSNNEFSIITDRKEAIKQAIAIAESKDIIIITGKGHEKSMNIKGVEYAWSDRECVLGFV